MLNTKQYQVNIGIIIKNTREKKRLSQIDLAESIGINRVYLSGVENGSRTAGLTNLVLIATALKIPLSELITQAEQLSLAS